MKPIVISKSSFVTWIKIGIVFIIILSAVPIVSSVSAQQASDTSASLLPQGGLIQFLPYGSDNWQNVTKGIPIHVGDEIRTGSDGAATLSVGTGITFKIYPDSFVQLQSINIGSALSVRLSQFLGITQTTVDQVLKSLDSVEVVTPATVATVHGTSFFTFVGVQGSTAFIGEDHQVIVTNLTGVTVKNGADNATFYQMQAAANQVCTVDFLTKSGQGFTFTDLSLPDDLQKLRNFLTELFKSNDNANLLNFMSSYLGLSSNATQQDILDKLSSFDKPGQLSDFLNALRKYLIDYFNAIANGNIAPATCGNGKSDPGETAQNCPTDNGDTSNKGNNVCETLKGESLINDTADCFPINKSILDCSVVMLAGGFDQVKKFYPPTVPPPSPTTPWQPPPPNRNPPGPTCVQIGGACGKGRPCCGNLFCGGYPSPVCNGG